MGLHVLVSTVSFSYCSFWSMYMITKACCFFRRVRWENTVFEILLYAALGLKIAASYAGDFLARIFLTPFPCVSFSPPFPLGFCSPFFCFMGFILFFCGALRFRLPPQRVIRGIPQTNVSNTAFRPWSLLTPAPLFKIQSPLPPPSFSAFKHSTFNPGTAPTLIIIVRNQTTTESCSPPENSLFPDSLALV